MHDAHAVAVVQRLITMSTFTRVRLKKTIDNPLISNGEINILFLQPQIFNLALPIRYFLQAFLKGEGKTPLTWLITEGIDQLHYNKIRQFKHLSRFILIESLDFWV